MIRFVIALALLCGAQSLPAQQPSTPPAKASKWMQSDEKLILVDARIALPVHVAGLQLKGTKDFSHPGDAIDSAALYESTDAKVFATAYIFYPGLPHSGLAALATDAAIRSNSSTAVTGPQWEVVQAAGGKATALQGVYGHYRGTLASRAAFLKGGRYIVKLRVSGPEERRQEVDAAMAALLAGVDFGRASPPYPAAPLAVTPCSGGEENRQARMLPVPSSGDLAAITVLGTFDGGGIDATDENGKRAALPSRVPNALCSTRLANGMLVLRSGPGEAPSVDGRTRLVVLMSDAGEMIELVDAPNLNGSVMLHHGIGISRILGLWSGVPSNAQLEEILSGKKSDANRILSEVVLRPGKGAELHLPGQAEDQAPVKPVPRS